MLHPQKSNLLLSFRFLLAVLLFMAFILIFAQRTNMSIGIICMINNTAFITRMPENNNSKAFFDQTSMNETQTLVKCAFDDKLNSTSLKKDGPFAWSKQTQGLILSSFFYGNILTMIPGGWLTVKYGGKNVLCLVILLSSLMTLLTPLASISGYVSLTIACRFLAGFFQGPCFPAIGQIIVNFVPLHERSRLIGLTFSGIQLGNLIATLIGGIFCSLDNDDGNNSFLNIFPGWSLNFYFFGILGLIWTCAFYFLGSDTPEKNRFVRRGEREYLSAYLVKPITDNKTTKTTTPWSKILTSRIVITLNLCCLCYNWGLYLYLTQIPSYVRDVLKFDVKSNGLMSSIPYLICWILLICSSFLADYIVTKKVMKVLTVRKIFTSLNMLLPVIPLIALTFIDCSRPYLAVFLLTLGYSFNGLAGSGGFFVNLYEIGGQYTGVIIGLVNTIGTFAGIIAPFLVGFITQNRKQEEWNIVFWITSLIYVAGFVAYILFADVKIQSWATNTNKASNNKKNDSREAQETKEALLLISPPKKHNEDEEEKLDK